MSSSLAMPQISALDQVASPEKENTYVRSLEQSRFLCVGFEIPIDESLCGHTIIPRFQIVPLLLNRARVRGIGEQGVPVSDENFHSMAHSGDALTVYPGVIMDSLETRYGNPSSPQTDWGLVEFKRLRNAQRWNETELREAGLTDEDLYAEDEAASEENRTPRAPWAVLIAKLNGILFPSSLEIFSTDPRKEDGMLKRVEDHLRNLVANGYQYGNVPVARECAQNALDMVLGTARWIENELRGVASEIADGGGRRSISGSEVPWRRYTSLELPGNMALAGLLPNDPEYKRNQQGVFSDADKEFFMRLLAGKAQENPVSFDDAVKDAAEKMAQEIAEKKVAELLKSNQVTVNDGPPKFFKDDE